MEDLRLRILHVEDVKSDMELVDYALKKGLGVFDKKWVSNRSDYLKALDEFRPDIVLCDHSLPSFTSDQALELLKTYDPEKRIPFILITATVSEEFAVNMMKLGVDDYILKDRLQRLPDAVNKALAKVRTEVEKRTYLNEVIRSERKFRALIENSNDSIVLLDSDLNITYRSPSVYRIFGQGQEGARKELRFDLIHTEDVEAVKKVVSDCLEFPGKALPVNFRFSHRTGRYIWLEGLLTNFLTNPDVKALVLNFSDVSARKSAEEAVLKHSRHFKALIENITDAIVLVDEAGKIVYNSPSVERITGLKDSDTLNKSIFDFIHVDDLDTGKAFFEGSKLAPGAPKHGQLRIRNRGGVYISVEGSIINLLADEHVQAYVLNYRDITERLDSQSQLTKSEATLRTVVNNTELGYVLLNRAFHVVSYNERAKTLFKREFFKDLTEGKYLFDYLPEDRQAITRTYYNKVLHGQKLQYETFFNQADETVNWYHVNLFPVFDENKVIHGLVLATEDITLRKRAELEREAMTTDLLQHNKNLEQFAYIISHNLRSSVANILGLSNLLESPHLLNPTEMERCLGGIRSSAKKLDEIIFDLNHILQKRGQLNEKREKVLLEALVEDIKLSFGEKLRTDEIRIDTDFAENPEIPTVKSYLHSIFYNLISNSIKYRKSGKPCHIQIRSTKLPGKTRLEFSDNGRGIDLEQHGEKLFGLYKKFHPEVEGKGMGLYMVKSQVELLNGTVIVESAVNTGTRFTLEFPDRSPTKTRKYRPIHIIGSEGMPNNSL